MIDLRGAGSVAVEPSAVLQVHRLGALALPQAYSLAQNFPNPFNPATTIRYELSDYGSARLSVYDLGGQRIRQLVGDYQQAGHYKLAWDGRDASGARVATGVYLYGLRTGDFRSVRKMLLMK